MSRYQVLPFACLVWPYPLDLARLTHAKKRKQVLGKSDSDKHNGHGSILSRHVLMRFLTPITSPRGGDINFTRIPANHARFT